MPRQTGMTLLELLVALAIFAMLAAMAYGGLNAVLRTGHKTGDAAQRLAQLQMAFHLLEKDLMQAVPRPIRQNHTMQLPAMIKDIDSGGLEFTRTGRPNPSGLQRSHLLRVRYRLEDETLFRDHWNLIDRPDDGNPKTTPLMSGLSELILRFHLNGNESPNWPIDSNDFTTLPEAVEIELVLNDWGHFKRLVIIR